MAGLGFNIPLPFVIFGVLLITFTAMLEGSSVAEKDQNADGSAGLGTFLSLVGNIMTFNIGGAPWWIRFPFSVIMACPVVWLILAIIEGLIP